MVARDVISGVAMPTGGFRKEEEEGGRIPNGVVGWVRPNGVPGRGDGVLSTYGVDDRVELRRFRGLFFSGDFRSLRSCTASLSSLAGISSKLVSTCRKTPHVSSISCSLT